MQPALWDLYAGKALFSLEADKKAACGTEGHTHTLGRGTEGWEATGRFLANAVAFTLILKILFSAVS